MTEGEIGGDTVNIINALVHGTHAFLAEEYDDV